MTGQTLLQYKILEKLGEGGMGVVYKARDTRLGRLVAIKVLPQESTGNPDRKRRFIQEARTASSLNHPNIVTVYDIAEVAGLHFIAMEFIAGKTLHAAIAGRRLEIAKVLHYAIQITDALAKAHSAGVVHRDLKPANIMVTEGQVKILDFGLAKLFEPLTTSDPEVSDKETLPITHDITQQGAILGTAAYMSPEQAEGKPVDARSDIFSVGAILYEMITGRGAFRGDNNISVLSAIIRDEPPLVSHVVPDVPRDMEKIISRCLRKDPGRRFQHVLDIKLALEELKQEYDSGTLLARQQLPQPHRRSVLVALGLAASVALGLSVWWFGMPTTPRQPGLLRLTSDSGISGYPALSPDGKLLAYASDRAGENNLDLWIKQVPAGEPIRLTHHESDEYEPAFAPDGTRLAYRSEQNGGGIYVIPALGGEPRLLVKRGRSPRFSPDGSEILYRVTDSADSFWGDIFIMRSTGGAPRQVHAKFPIAFTPIWTPDGKHILFWGAATHAFAPDQLDWWVAPVDGGAPVKTGAAAVLKKVGLSAGPDFWVPKENRVVFSASTGTNSNIWQVSISAATWRVESPASRVTFGTTDETNPSVAEGGRLAFASSIWNADLWAMPLDANTGTKTGDLMRLTQDSAADIVPYASADGRKVVFLSDRRQTGRLDVWLKSMPSGREQPLTFTGDLTFFPIITPDGSRVAYQRRENNHLTTYVVAADGGAPEKICDDCGQPRGWLSNQRTIISQVGTPLYLILLDTHTRTSKVFLRHSSASLYSAQFSPDGKWVAFGARLKPDDERVFVVPVANETAPQDMAHWIPITSGPALDNKPRWSPDGNLLYFTSDRDEFSCVWAQRLNPTTKQPVGIAFPTLHLHGAVRSFAKSGSLKLDISVARDKLFFHLEEMRGNIWMTQLPDH